MISLLIQLATQPAMAWGSHFLIANGALQHPSVDYADDLVAAESLEDFLAATGQDLPALFDGYYDWLEARGSKRFNRMSFDPNNPTVVEFLHAARLNPAAHFALTNRPIPGATRVGEPMDKLEVSPYLSLILPPFASDFDRVEPGQQVSAGSVLCTFADEPDWGFDHELWDFAEYGYGEIPYGKPQGESSKAAFHVLYAHENFLVRMSAPEILEGMSADRVEMFLRLSRFAFAHGHDYWGYRFAAWATHFAQDLAQPYHSMAIPSARAPFYLHYVVSPRKPKLKAEATQLTLNRHFLYEDFVSYGLQQSALTDDAPFDEMVAYLGKGDATLAGVSDTDGLIATIGQRASDHAPTIDRTVRKAFGGKLTEDPSYDVEHAPDYDVAKVIAGMEPKAAAKLVVETGTDFTLAGEGTRTIVALARTGQTP